MMPNNVLSVTPEPAAFLPPRTNTRFSAATGQTDFHYGGIAVDNPSAGITYQLWTARCDGKNIYLSAPNTPEYTYLANCAASWVALAFDQNCRLFLAWADINGNASYYWYDSTIPGYRTSALTGVIKRIFCTLDDNRPAESSLADVIVAYVRSNELYFRQQRDRFGVEYDLGAAPASLVQLGMNRINRLQFAFQNIQGNAAVPPAEYSGASP